MPPDDVVLELPELVGFFCIAAKFHFAAFPQPQAHLVAQLPTHPLTQLPQHQPHHQYAGLHLRLHSLTLY